MIPFCRHVPAFMFLMIMVCISASVRGQQFSYVHYDEKDGLPSATVYDVCQDTDGFIWFATENGLVRFDGTHFKTFSTTDGLPDNSILFLHADKKGRIYFSPFTHTPYYYYKGEIHKLKFPPEYAKDISLILRMHNFNDRMLLVNDGSGGSYLLDKNDSLIPLHHIFTKLPGPVSTSFQMMGDYLITGTVDSLYTINLKDSSVQVSHNDFYGIRLTILSNGELHTRGKMPSNMLFINGWIANDIWYETDESGDVVFYSRINGDKLYNIHIDKPSKCFIDSENNLWITTTGHGVYRFPSFEFRLAKINNAGEISSLNASSQGIWIGTDYSKIHLLGTGKSPDPALQADFSSYLSKSLNVISVASKTNKIRRIIFSKDTTYIGADAFLLKIIKNKSSVFSEIFPVKDIDTSGNRLLVCTGRTVLLVDASLNKPDTLLHSRSTAGVFYNGDYYVATLGGLLKIRSDKSTVDLSKRHPVLAGRITGIQRGNDNDLWITSSGKGLIHYKNDSVIRVMGKKSGLTSDICTSVFVDGKDIWVGTNKGLNKVDISSGTPRVISFTTANGLTSNFINTVFVHNDTVYAASGAGLTYFNKHLEKTSSICRLHILEISQGNHVLPLDSVYHFPFNAMNIRIAFTAISFKSAGDNTYYYQLEGLDNGWNTTSSTFINYPTLPSGTYRFVLKAVNKFGVESETRSITIVIAYPWWQSWWVWPAGILIVAAIVFFVYRNKIKNIRKQEKLKRENEARLVLLEQQALQAQMNPHFIFNCLNSIQAYILKLDAAGASKYLNAFASMIRQTLDFSSKLLITVADEVKYIHTYLQLEKLRYKEKFNYAIEVDDEIDQTATLMPGMLLQPYIENSLRHGIQHRPDNDGFITLKIMAGKDNGIICQVIDNGIGRTKAEEFKSVRHIEYQSKGTSISAKRIAAINNQLNTNIHIRTEDILDQNGKVTGTLVSIGIPDLNKTHL